MLEHLAEHERVRVREIPQLPVIRQETVQEPLIEDPSHQFRYPWKKSEDQDRVKAAGKTSRIGRSLESSRENSTRKKILR